MRSQPETLRVELGDRSYDVLVGSGLLEEAHVYIAPFLKQKRATIVTDTEVAQYQLARLQAGLDAGGIRSEIVTVPEGDQSKSFEVLAHVLESFISMKLERSDTVIALGGGMVGDLTGFAASIYLRGIDFIQVPTTLLAQVDSSVGGKTAINSAASKNMIGTFHQPKLVLADISALASLPARQMRAGYAETLKYGLIRDRRFFDWLSQQGDALINGDADCLRHAVLQSCCIKAEIVSADETEHGIRSLLNLGHTFGHALEAATGFSDRLLHGEGVAIGMILAFELSEASGFTSPSDVALVRDHLNLVGLPSAIHQIEGGTPGVTEILDHMAHDKKVSQGQIRFILPRGIGEAFETADIDMSAVKSIIERSCEA